LNTVSIFDKNQNKIYYNKTKGKKNRQVYLY
jgi:hypothetical protein